MKRTFIGVSLLISATLADIGIMLSTAILATVATDSHIFWDAIMANDFLLPFVLAKVLFAVALFILMREYFNKPTK